MHEGFGMINVNHDDPHSPTNLFSRIGPSAEKEEKISIEISLSVDSSDCKKSYIKDLGEKIRFKTEYPVTAVYEDNEFVATLMDLNLYGSGDTEFEAIEMLKREINTLYDDVKDQRSKDLGKHPRAWKKFFERNIEII